MGGGGGGGGGGLNCHIVALPLVLKTLRQNTFVCKQLIYVLTFFFLCNSLIMLVNIVLSKEVELRVELS